MMALTVFGTIIFFHYCSVDYTPSHEEKEYLVDATDKPWLNYPDLEKGNPSIAKPDIFDDLIQPKKRMTNAEFRKKNALYPKNEKGDFVIVVYPAEGPYLTSHPEIKDIRVPLFVLAVFIYRVFLYSRAK